MLMQYILFALATRINWQNNLFWFINFIRCLILMHWFLRLKIFLVYYMELIHDLFITLCMNNFCECSKYTWKEDIFCLTVVHRLAYASALHFIKMPLGLLPLSIFCQFYLFPVDISGLISCNFKTFLSVYFHLCVC